MPVLRGFHNRRRPSRRDERGLALVATLLVIAVIGVITAAGVTGAINTLRSSSADYREAQAFYAAEAGVEAGLAQLKLALQDGRLEESELAEIDPPSLPGYSFEEFKVEKDGPSEVETLTDGPYAGLFALVQDVVVTSKATGSTGAHSAIVVGARTEAIPVFQFAIFFEGDFEEYAGSEKHATGRVHANGDLFINGNGPLYYHDMLTTPGKFHRDDKTDGPESPTTGIYIDDAGGNAVNVTFDSDDTPDPQQFKAKSNASFDGRLRTDAFGVEPLTLPLPDGIPARELVRPKEGSDTESEKATKLAWNADMYVTVDMNNTQDRDDVCGGGASTRRWPTITVERPFGGTVPNDVDKCDIFEFTWEAFYDWFEHRWVDVLDVDFDDLRDWVNVDPSDRNPSLIYVEFVEPTGTMPEPDETNPHTEDGNDGVFPAFRTKDASELHGPLTAGSEYPIYQWGDFNTTSKKPAALFGDRLAILSNNWSDPDEDDDTPPIEPNATHTYGNYSIITGSGAGQIGCYYADPTCVQPEHGPGGWIKSIEDWKACGGKCTQALSGSIVFLWAPVHATPYGGYPEPKWWKYYNAPKRDYSFDTDLLDPDNLPPGTPNVGKVLRATFRESY